MSKRWQKLAVVMVCCGLGVSPAFGWQDQTEEVVIGNQDGGTIRKVEIQRQEQQGDGSQGSQFRIEGDKIIIIGADGKRQEIDISGAKSVAVQQSVETVDRDGDAKTVERGKAIIIGPDGERREIELGGPLEMGDGTRMLRLDGPMAVEGFLLPQVVQGEQLPLPELMRAQLGMVGKYMIGVNCEPVPPALRSHLKLEEGTGLVVQSIVEDSAAAAAGVREFDILMSVNGQPLTTTEQLVEAVQKAGESEAALELVGIREGSEMSFSVTPAERTANPLQWQGNLRGPIELQFDKLGPGVIVGEGAEAAFRMEFQTMQEELRKLREDLKKLRQRELGDDD